MAIERRAKSTCIALVLAWALLVLVSGCKQKASTLSASELLSLSFENTLDPESSAKIQFLEEAGQAQYADGQQGQALYPQGAGDWIEGNLEVPLSFPQGAEVEFWIKRENWRNPYKKGSVAQTMLVLSGRSDNKWRHVSFNLRPSNWNLVVNIHGYDGVVRLKGDYVFDTEWHKIRLRYERASARVELFIDDRLVASDKQTIPVFDHGVSRVKFGTWFKTNQAYRGLIDEFRLGALN